jgi:hypothetical protein
MQMISYHSVDHSERGISSPARGLGHIGSHLNGGLTYSHRRRLRSGRGSTKLLRQIKSRVGHHLHRTIHLLDRIEHAMG